MNKLATVLDTQRVDSLNRDGRQPVLFIHGLWLEPSSWDRWTRYFEEHGYACSALEWPQDRRDVDGDRENATGESETLLATVEKMDEFAVALDRRPVLIGHSFGGLIAQLLADRGHAAATIAIAPAAFRGVLPLPLSAIRSASPVLLNPANRHKRVSLTFDQFRYAFANALDEKTARDLFDRFAVPAPGGPLFEAALSNLNPWTDDRLDPRRSARGPMLLVAGEADHTVPPAVVEAEYKLQKSNQAVTEYQCIAGRGHSLVIDPGWEQVASLALAFARRFAPASLGDAALDEAERGSFPASDPPAL